MSNESQDMAPTMYPYFGYHDAATALKWLADAFGFQKTAEIAGPDGKVMHAEMTFGNGAIMLGTTDSQRHAPADHGIYIYVDDVDAHYERAKAVGAHVVYPPEKTEWGTKRYRVLDPEGYEWSFGTYRPSMGSR